MALATEFPHHAASLQNEPKGPTYRTEVCGRVVVGVRTYPSLQTENDQETSVNLPHAAVVVICGALLCRHCVIQSLLFLRTQ